MKYASVIIGVIVLIIVLGVVFAVMPKNNAGVAYNTYPIYSAGLPENIPVRSYNLQPVNYQASALGTYQSGYQPYQASYGYRPYQASVINAVPVSTGGIVTNMAVNAPAAGTIVAAGYPYPGNTYGTVPAVPVVPVVWYTAPSGPYTISVPASTYYSAQSGVYANPSYNYSSQYSTVIPGNTTVTPGGTNVYNYNTPGYSNGMPIYQTGNGQWYQ